MKKILIMHHIDADGYCGAYWALKWAKKTYPEIEEIEFLPCNYGWTFEGKFDSETVAIVVDFTLPVFIMKQLHDVCKKFVWVDHHGTALAKAEEPENAWMKSIDGIRYDGIAASELMYWYYMGYTPYFFEEVAEENVKGHLGALVPEPMPIGTWFVSDNDTWTHTFEETKWWADYIRPFMYPTRFDEYNIKFWDLVFADNNYVNTNMPFAQQVFENGKLERAEFIKKNGYESKLLDTDGTEYSVLVADTNKGNSLIFESVETAYDIFVKHYVDKNGKHKYTLYIGNADRSKDIHLGQLCSRLSPNGGGHPGAAGFESDTHVFG